MTAHKKDLTECDIDFLFYTQKEKIRYHSECGAFYDITGKRSVAVSENEHALINSCSGIN